MKFKFLQSLNLTDEARSKVSRSLERTVSGSDVVVTSPVAKRKDPETILQEWDKIFYTKREVLSDNLLTLEQSERSKFGPRSLAKKWVDRSETLNSYFSRSNGILSDAKVADLKVPSGLSARLRPLSPSQAIKLLKNSTSSGLPYMARKGEIKSLIERDFEETLKHQYPCVLFTRTQEQMKTRNVWGYPVADTVQEMRFYRPVLKFQQHASWRRALQGPDSVDIGVNALMKRNKDIQGELVSIDFSSYDASINKTLQKASFDYISEMYQPKYHTELAQIAERFSTIAIVTPDGIKSGYHGVPSGSTFTNEVDSIAQYLVAKNFGVDSRHMQIQGDDGLYCTTKASALKDHFQSFGLNVNEEKSMVSHNTCTFLQRLYDPFYAKDGFIGGIYSVYRALNRIIYPERFIELSDDVITGRDYHSIRVISILENCKYHPLFREFVEFVYSLDKYGLAYSPQGLQGYINTVSAETNEEGITMNQYGTYTTGLQTFDTVKLLSKLK